MTISATIFSAVVGLIMSVSPAPTSGQVLAAETVIPAPQILATENYSLTDRYHNTYVNDVFADNILLTLAYMDGQQKAGQPVNWDKVQAPSQSQFTLQPGQTFAFHDQVLPQYKNSVVQTTHADFSSDQGFKSDGYLVGDGVCHFASFLNLVSTEAGLTVNAPTNHDFAKIPDVDKKYGTAIYYDPNSAETSQRENLYVTNNLTKPVTYVFNHQVGSLQIIVEEQN